MSYPLSYSRELISNDRVGDRQCLWKVALIKKRGGCDWEGRDGERECAGPFNKTLSVKHISREGLSCQQTHIHAVACQEGCQGAICRGALCQQS